MNSTATQSKQAEREEGDLTARPIESFNRYGTPLFLDDSTTIIPFYEFLSRGWRASLIAEASEICRECSQPDWDGYDAAALSEEAFVQARNFINLLPDRVSQPDLVPSPDGWLSFEWRSPEDGILSVTIENGILIYATSLGQDHEHCGRVPLAECREKLPPCIENILAEYF